MSYRGLVTVARTLGVMPTGVAIRDPREQLFDAADRILARDGVGGLTSRAVTAEAGCAKGVLHRHFADFDAFLAELVVDRIGRLDSLGERLRAAAGSGTVAENLTDALTEVFGPVARSVLGLVTARDDVRARLRETTPHGVPLLTEAGAMLRGYLEAERALGRVDADPHTLALTLIGTAHLVLAGPTDDDLHQTVLAVLR